MKATAEKSTTSTTASKTASQPFFAKAGSTSFFARTSTPFIQMKLEVNKPGDKFEQEADRMAGKVMRMPAPVSPIKEEKLQRAPEEKLQKKEDERIQKAPAIEEKVQRHGTGLPTISAGTQSAIQNQTGGGVPLSADVRSYMEPRFGADFGNVRIHANTESATLSNQLSARAFTYQNHIFFSKNQFQPGTSEGKELLAHELTHTIQQGHAIQRAPEVSTTTTPPPIQRLGVQDALDYFADKAFIIPGFRLLTIIMGFNPINMRSTDRSAANILRGLIELVPGGFLITQALDNHGVFNKAGAWVEQQLATLGDIGGDLVGALKRFMDSLSWTDILDLGGVWDRAKKIFTAPISRLLSFAGSVVMGILKLVKDAVLRPLAKLAEGTAGYDLLKAVLGQDPITGDPVPQNADTLIGGFMKLIGQEEIWQNIKRGNAVAKAWAWFQGALEGLMGFVRSIPTKVIETVNSITWEDIITIVGVFRKVGAAFLDVAGRFFNWAGAQVITLLEIIFSVVAPGAIPYIKKAKGAFNKIIQDPIGFVGNLVNAGKKGFNMFASNIVEHLKTALIKWIVGPLADAGVYIPKAFSLVEILKLVLSVLGLTYAQIREKLVTIIPEPVLVVMEKTAGVLVTLVKDGPAAAWQEIKSEVTELKDSLIAKMTEMVTTEVVKAAVMKVVSMLNPAGAVIQAIIAVYNTITFFIQKINQIAAVVGAFIDSISAIAAGQIDNAAKKVEATMANTLVVIIAFLAKFAGLGGIPDKVVGIVKKVREPVIKGRDKIIDWLAGMLKKAGGAIKGFVASLFKPKSFKVGDEDHKIYPDPSGEPMVASGVPKRLADALTEVGGDMKAARALAKLKEKIKAAPDKAAAEKLQQEADKLIDEIVAILVAKKFGSSNKPMKAPNIAFTVKGDANEFKRQIAMQQAELITMEVKIWQINRARFIGFGRNTKPDSDLQRRTAIVERLIANPNEAVEVLKFHRLLSVADEATVESIKKDPKIKNKTELLHDIAKKIMNAYGKRKLAVLHRVDQVAGGSPVVYGDDASVFGSTKINSEIGNQWKTKVELLDKAVTDVDPKQKMKVNLTT